jgi:hypothetical protein
MTFVNSALSQAKIGSIAVLLRGLLVIPLIYVMSCSGRGNVDLSKATKLKAEPVEPPKVSNAPVDPLFKYAPGSSVSMKSLGTIDQTGLSLVSDYDGDGIANTVSNNPADNREVYGGSNQWVADYPIVEASVAPPVTMKIQVLKYSQTQNDEIVSQINSDDYEEVKEKGTEKIHQNEVNARSTQIQDSYAAENGSSGSTSSSSESEASASIGIGPISIGGGGSSSSSRSESWSNKTAYSGTKTTFPTQDFKNNLDRDAVSMKSDAAARNARKYRVDRTQKKKDEDKIEPNAGTVRAALYIKNLSANMPVRLTNILCTFMFEANNGQLIPVQSFRLRNDDYSLFSVNIYGGSEFGPYVVELTGLNTAEIERALQLGFNPKIFIVDYEMTHVANSNYKNVLTSYQGDNLKIVEENTKGRTALVKIKGPQMREMYRVAAFTVSNESATDSCIDNNGTAACPGISMRKALERIRDAATVRGQQYYATNVEYSDYIFDFSEDFPRMPADQQKVYMRTVKTIGSVSNHVPCEPITQSAGMPSASAAELNIVNVPVCKVKTFKTFSPAERQEFGLWVVFANGKFYTHSEYERLAESDPNSALKTFTYNTSENGSKCYNGCSASVARGIDSTVWVGDNFDWVYLTYEQFLFLKKQFGNNPLETGEVLNFNTKWDLGDANTNVFDPQYHSKYLGQAVLGDRLEIVVNLQDTKFLNPKFHADDSNGNLFVENFSYDPKLVDKKFSFNEAIDFEINLGVGDQPGDWGNITQPANGTNTVSKNAYFTDNNGNGIKNCGKNLDYLTQQFKICVELPASLPNANADGRVNVYLRPILHNAYRNSVWPKKYSEVNKFQGELAGSYTHPANAIDLVHASGEALPSDKLLIAENGYQCEYTINTIDVNTNSQTAHLTLSNLPVCNGLPASPATVAHSAGLTVGVRAADLLASEVYFSISQNTSVTPATNYFDDFNSAIEAGHPLKLLSSNALLNSTDCANDTNPLRYGPTCFGIAPGADDKYSFVTTNWIGGANSTRGFNDARHLRDRDYLTVLADGFYQSISQNSRWRFFTAGTVDNTAQPTGKSLNTDIASGSAAHVFRYKDKVAMLSETFAAGIRSIHLKVVDAKQGIVLLQDTVIETDEVSPDGTGFQSLHLVADQHNNKLTVAYATTWLTPVLSNVRSPLFVPDQYQHRSFLAKRVIDLNGSTYQSEEVVLISASYDWIKSFQIAQKANGDAVINYSTESFMWKNEYKYTVNEFYYYTCSQWNGQRPLFFSECINAPENNGGDSNCRVQCGLDCNAFGENCDPIYLNLWANAVNHDVEKIGLTAPETGGADECVTAVAGPNGFLASGAAGCTSDQQVDSVTLSGNERKAFVSLRDLNSGLVSYARNVDLTKLTELRQISHVYEDYTSFTDSGFLVDAGKSEKFGDSTVARFGYSPNSTWQTFGLRISEYGQAPVFLAIGSNVMASTGNKCTASRCVHMQKFAPYVADLVWLEDDQVTPSLRRLYHVQATVLGAQGVVLTYPRMIHMGVNIDSPASVISNERINVISWLENGSVVSKTLTKQSDNLPESIGAGINTLFTPASGYTLNARYSFDEYGKFYVMQTTGSEPLWVSFLQLNPAAAFTPQYGLNNFFAAPLIERNYTATAKVLIK